MSVPDSVNLFAGLAVSSDEVRALRKQLEILAEGAKDPRIKEMARAVLGGRTDLRAAMLGNRYEDVLNEAMGSFSPWYRNLSGDERTEQERRGRVYVDELPQEARRSPAGDGWESPASILRKEPPRR